MGKVYDALQRAEGKRVQNIEEAKQGEPGLRPHQPVASRVGAVADFGRRAPRWWERALGRGDRTEPESAADLNKRRISLLQPDSHASECFRSLRNRIDSLALQRSVSTIAVTSAVPAEGKTFTAMNLAIVSAMGVDQRVLLVDCDLRQPRIHMAFGLLTTCGLGEVLAGEVGPEEAIVRVEGSQLDVLPVHALPPNPSELLGSNQMKSMIDALSTQYDKIILDVPPVLTLPEAKTVSDLCDGIVFVVREGMTSQDQVGSALEVLDRSRLLGVLFNGSGEGPKPYSHY